MKKNKQPLHNYSKDDYDYLKSSASFQDCTGLIPSAPLSNDELQNYQELYPFLPKASIPKDSVKASPKE